MKRTRLYSWYLVFLVAILTACSINISEATPATPITVDTLPTPSPGPGDATQQTRIGNPLLPTTTIPVTWADLNLTGKLIYINAYQASDGNPILSIRALDLVTGVITTIFEGPEISWVYYVSVSPDAKQLVMSYSTPPQDQGSTSQLLYVMPLDGATQPQLLVLPPSIYDQYIQAEWSPDGKYIYYVHFNYQDQPVQQHYPDYEIFRMAYPNGSPEKIADQAFWPRLSPDSSRFAYISMDPASGANKLFAANADGSNAQEVVRSGPWTPDIIDAPIFSPDGQSILFSTVSPTQSYVPNWFEKLLGVQVAQAHTIPSDWWSVPLTGGVVTQLTHLQAAGLFASISPDKRFIASYSGNGLFVMNPDGTGLTMLIPDMGGIIGTVDWIP
jgi:Tol biopolymer transport system component